MSYLLNQNHDFDLRGALAANQTRVRVSFCKPIATTKVLLKSLFSKLGQHDRRSKVTTN